jgi:hypothetical protein
VLAVLESALVCDFGASHNLEKGTLVLFESLVEILQPFTRAIELDLQITDKK